MQFYKLIKLNRLISNFRLKFLGLLILHVFKKRYLAVHLDPVNACNLRCKMCYFTDEDYVKKLKGIFKEQDIQFIANAFFKRAVKLQIGCGTEPTLFKDITGIIKSAKQSEVPYISLTTNANKISYDKLESWVVNGLNEITISLHGVTKPSYENFMDKGDFGLFMNSLKIITQIKEKHPLTLRINYTFNEDNFEELKDFYSVFDGVNFDYLQIRPIKKLGNTSYNNFSLDKITPIYNSTLEYLKKESLKRNVQLIAHNPFQLQNRKSTGSLINKYVYCYISPTQKFKKDFKWHEETYNQYASRTQITKQLINDIFAKKSSVEKLKSDKLNYEVNS